MLVHSIDNLIGSNKVLNGVSSNGKQSTAVNSPHSTSSGTPNQINNGDIQKNEKMSGNTFPVLHHLPFYNQIPLRFHLKNAR